MRRGQGAPGVRGWAGAGWPLCVLPEEGSSLRSEASPLLGSRLTAPGAGTAPGGTQGPRAELLACGA